MHFILSHYKYPIHLLLIFLILASCSKKKFEQCYIKLKTKNHYLINYDNYLHINSGNSINLSFPEIPQSLNPFTAYSISESFFKNALFSSLFYINPKNGYIEKNLVSSYSVSDDGCNYTFILKNNIKFSNNEDLTSDDVVESLKLLNTVLRHSALYDDFFILNAELNVSRISDYVFKISTDVPNSNLLYALARYPIIQEKKAKELYSMSTKEFLSEWDYTKSIDIIGCGPYKVLIIDEGHAVLVKNPNYFKYDETNNRLPYTSKIEIKFYPNKKKEILSFIQGESDILSLKQEDYDNLKKYSLQNSKIRVADTGFSMDKMIMLFNFGKQGSKSFLNDIDIRNYISKAISVSLLNNMNLQIPKKIDRILDEYKKNIPRSLYDFDYDGILEYKDRNTVFIRIIVPEEEAELIEIGKMVEYVLGRLNFDTFFEKAPYQSFLDRVLSKNDYDLAFIYYSFFPGINPYINLLKVNFPDFFINKEENRVLLKDNSVSELIREYLNSRSIQEQNQKIKRLEEYCEANCYFYKILEQKRYYLLNKNIYNFKLNSLYENYFNLKTIETIFKNN